MPNGFLLRGVNRRGSAKRRSTSRDSPFRRACGLPCSWSSAAPRFLWCRFCPRQDMRTLIDSLEDALRYYGGVPQELLFDPMKAVISATCGSRVARWPAVSSFSASPTTGASRRVPVGRIAPQP